SAARAARIVEAAGQRAIAGDRAAADGQSCRRGEVAVEIEYAAAEGGRAGHRPRAVPVAAGDGECAADLAAADEVDDAVAGQSGVPVDRPATGQRPRGRDIDH